MTDETSLMGNFEENELEEPNEGDDQTIDLRAEAKKPQFDRPEDLPGDLWDEESGTFKSMDLYNAWKNEKEKALQYRRTISKGLPKAAKSVDEYILELEEGVEVDPEDETIDTFREIALNAGLTKDQFNNVMGGFLKAAKDGKFSNSEEAPELSEEEESKRVQQEIQLLGKDAPKVISNLKEWGRQLFHEGVLSKEDLESYMELGVSARQIRVLDKLRQAAGYINDVPVSAGSVNGSKSYEEILAMMKDPRYENDPSYRRPIDEWFQQNT